MKGITLPIVLRRIYEYRVMRVTLPVLLITCNAIHDTKSHSASHATIQITVSPLTPTMPLNATVPFKTTNSMAFNTS